MLLTYSNWKGLNESESKQKEHYFSLDLIADNKRQDFNLKPSLYQEAAEIAFPQVREVFPDSELGQIGTIIIKNTKYEDLDGKLNDLVLDFNQLLSESKYSAAYFRYPKIIIDILSKEVADQIISPLPRDYEFIPKEKFEEFSPEELRDFLMAECEKKILVGLGVDLEDFSNLAGMIETLMIQGSLGEAFKDPQTENQVMAAILAKSILAEVRGLLEKAKITKETISLLEIEKELSAKTARFLIDYAALKRESRAQTIADLVEYLKYLNGPLRRRSGALKKLGIDNLRRILSHLSQYPEIADKIYAV